MIIERDTLFSSDFMKQSIPKEKSWMNKYFKTRTRKMFLKYYSSFESATRFREHSGEVCTKRYVKKMKKQLLVLVKIYDAARKNLDFELIAKMEMGRYRLM